MLTHPRAIKGDNGELPRQGSSTWVTRSASGRAPPLDLQTLIPALKVKAVTRRPPRLVSFKTALKVAAVMRQRAEMTRMQLDLLQYPFIFYIHTN
jgi:hypothetical protein